MAAGGLLQLAGDGVLAVQAYLLIMAHKLAVMAGQIALLPAVVGGQRAFADQLHLQPVDDLVAIDLVGLVQALEPQPALSLIR